MLSPVEYSNFQVAHSLKQSIPISHHHKVANAKAISYVFIVKYS